MLPAVSHPKARPPRAHPPAGLPPPLLGLPRRRCTARPPRQLTHRPRPSSQCPRPPASATHPRRPQPRPGLAVPAALRPRAFFHSTRTQAFKRRRAPSQFGFPRPSPRLGFPWPFPPVRHSRLSQLPTRSGPPFTRSLALPRRSGQSERPPALRALPVSQSLAQFGTRRPGRQSVRSFQPRAVRKASAPRAFRPLPQPHPLTLQSSGCPRPAAWPPESRPPRSVRQTAEAARRQSG